MPNVNNSPNMTLPIPSVGIESGPQWATDVNNCLTIIDQHNHAPGSGVQINPSGILINTNLPFNNNAATTLMAVEFTPQTSLADLTSLYVIGKELFYNDGAGNAVQLTLNGSIVGTAGSITGLVPPASASYAGSTFTFQSNSLTAANIDVASVVLRNNTASSNGLTLSPPNAMGANYALVLPALPGSTSFMTLDTSGNMAGSISTSGGITSSNIAAATITGSNIAAATIAGSNLINGTITTTQIASSTILLTNLATSARESVYANGISQTMSNGVTSTFIAPVVVSNTSGSYVSGNGLYTVPQNGYLDVASCITYTGVGSGTTYVLMSCELNGVEIGRSITSFPASGNPSGSVLTLVGYTVTAGDVIRVRGQYNGATVQATTGHLSFILR